MFQQYDFTSNLGFLSRRQSPIEATASTAEAVSARELPQTVPTRSSGSSATSSSTSSVLQQNDPALDESSFQIERRRLQLQLLNEKVNS